MKTIGILLIYFIVLSQSLLFAEEQPRDLALKDVVNLALQNNGKIKAAVFGAEAAAFGAQIALAGYLPQIAFEEAFTAANSPTRTFMMKLDQSRLTQNDFQIQNLNQPTTWHDFRTLLSINQPLFAPSVSPTREMAKQDADKGKIYLELAKEEIAFRTFRIYLDIQRHREQLKATGQAVTEARENVRLATVRREAGSGLRSDELRARTHLAQTEQLLITVQNDLLLAEMQLSLLTGLPEKHVSGRVEKQLFFLSVEASPEEMVKTAMQERADLRIADAEIAKAGAAVKLAKSAYLPVIGASASYQLNSKTVPAGSDNDAWMAGVSLNWQLFDGFRRGGEKNRAIAERSAAIEMLEEKNREAAFQVRRSYLRREESGKRLEVARHAVRDAEETVRLISRRFENSLSTMVELLDAETTLNQARAGLVNSQVEFALASGQIYLTAGIFLKEILK